MQKLILLSLVVTLCGALQVDNKVSDGSLIKSTPNRTHTDAILSAGIDRTLVYYYEGICLTNHFEVVQAKSEYDCFDICNGYFECIGSTYRPNSQQNCYLDSSENNYTLSFEPNCVTMFGSIPLEQEGQVTLGGPTISSDKRVAGLKAKHYDGIRLTNQYKHVKANSTWSCFEACKSDRKCDAITYEPENKDGCQFFSNKSLRMEFDQSWSSIFKAF